ncbi:MAG: hypothetical protein R3C10_27085 [Pirellulales bacterium]|nr:hypothetical protein [Planctomycetales bacterium]
MKRLKNRCRGLYHGQRGVLTFEWILLITLLTIGIVGGLSAVRDAMIDELGDVAEAVVSLDQSYTIVNPVEVTVHDGAIDGASNSVFIDEMTYGQCRGRDPFECDITDPNCNNGSGS